MPFFLWLSTNAYSQVVQFSFFLCLLLSMAPSARAEIVVDWAVIEEIPRAMTAPEIRDDAIRWLESAVPGHAVTSRELPRLSADWNDGSDTDIARLFDSMGPRPPQAGRLHILVAFAPRAGAYMGRTHHMSDGRVVIVMNARRLAFLAGAKGQGLRTSRVLRHELAHALGLVRGEDHLMLVAGRHCTDPACLLFGRVRLVDLAAGFLPAAFARNQPEELCGLCRRDLEAFPHSTQ
jgi:hypothetical protein